MNFVELQIRQKVIAELPPNGAPDEFAGALYPPDTLTTPADVRSSLPKVPGVVLVTMDECEGGGVDAGMAVYEALRDFSRAGGTVVVHIGRMAASTASVIALAGDVILMAPEARYIVHSTRVGGDVTGDQANRLRDRVNAHLLAVYEARGWIPRAALEDALAHEYDPARDVFRCVQVNASTAVQLGWADGVGSIEKARAAAALIASGLPPSSGRVAWLKGRQEPRWPGCSAFVTGSIQANHLDVDSINASGLLTVGAAQFTGTLPASKLSGTVPANQVGSGIQDSQITSIDGSKVVSPRIQTTNYAEDGSGNPTAGAKLDAQGTALKVAPGNFQLGSYRLSTTGRVAAVGRASTQPGLINNGAGGMNISSVQQVDRGSSYSPRYVLRFNLSVPVAGWVVVGQDHWNGASDGQTIAVFCSDTSSTSRIDVGFKGIDGQWYDPTGGSMYHACDVVLFAAW